MLLNASMGGPAVSITTQERLTFLDIDIPLGRSTGVAEKKGDVAESTTAGVYEVTIPCASDELLPSYKKSDLDQGEGARPTCAARRRCSLPHLLLQPASACAIRLSS